MNGPDLLFAAHRASLPATLAGSLLAYGPAPGVELIPYFLGLITWIGLALAAVAWAPIAALWRRVRGTRTTPPPEARGDGGDQAG